MIIANFLSVIVTYKELQFFHLFEKERLKKRNSFNLNKLTFSNFLSKITYYF